MEVSRYKKGIAGWVRWTIQHKKVVYLLVAALCVLGIWGVSRINKDEFPTFEMEGDCSYECKIKDGYGKII